MRANFSSRSGLRGFCQSWCRMVSQLAALLGWKTWNLHKHSAAYSHDPRSSGRGGALVGRHPRRERVLLGAHNAQAHGVLGHAARRLRLVPRCRPGSSSRRTTTCPMARSDQPGSRGEGRGGQAHSLPAPGSCEPKGSWHGAHPSGYRRARCPTDGPQPRRCGSRAGTGSCTCTPAAPTPRWEGRKGKMER